MFWTNIYTLSPHIEALLKKEDVSLQELMDQEEIVSECRSHNKKLVDYLSRPEIMKELVTLTTKEPSTDTDERSRYKYPNVACELLTCNVPSLNEKLAGDETLLAKLYSFIDTDEPLNPLLASFFSKTIGVLLTRRSDQNWYSYQFMCFHVLEFLKSRDKCVDRLLQHLETSAIMDLVLKLVTKVEGSDMRQNVLNWLDSEQLVQRLIKLLSPTSEPERHANAAQLLCDMVKLARYFRATCTERTEPDPILNTLESETTVGLLLDTILPDEPIESSIIGGIQVLLVLLGHETNNIGNEGDTQGNGTGEDATDQEGRVKIQHATLPFLELLQKLLLNPPPKPAVKTTAGLLTSPLGNARLHIAKLLVALLCSENIEIFGRLAQLGTFKILLDLFFKYSWNNFLHTQVEQCLASVVNGDWQDSSEAIFSHIFVECNLMSRLLDAWDQNQNKQNKETSVRQGYMGHLINIVNNIVRQCKKNPILEEYLKTNPSPECVKQWEELVTTELVEINKIQDLELGGKPQPYVPGSDDPNDEYNSYGQDAYIQQVYANYQGQQMTPNFIAHRGFHANEFDDRDDALHNSIDQLTTMPFTLNEEDLDKGEDMFNKICEQKQKAGLDESGGAAEWGDEGELTFQTVIDKRDWPSKQQRSNSSNWPSSNHDSNSSDEDEDTQEMSMEPDSSNPWESTEQFPSVLPRVNPWDVAPSDTAEYTGWANFDNFENTLNMAEALKIGETLPTSQEVNTESTTVAPAAFSNPAIPDDASVLVEPVKSPITPALDSNIETIENTASAKITTEENIESSNVEIVTIQEQSRKAQISEAPAKAQISEAPVKAQISEAPAKAQISEAPAKAQISEAPAKAQISEAPAKAQISEAPAKAQISEAPAKAQISETPAKAQISEAPAKAQISKAPAKAQISEAPAKAQISETPAKAQISETPVKAQISETPVKAQTSAESRPPEDERVLEKSPIVKNPRETTKLEIPEKLEPDAETIRKPVEQPGDVVSVAQTVPEEPKKSEKLTKSEEPDKQDKPQTML